MQIMLTLVDEEDKYLIVTVEDVWFLTGDECTEVWLKGDDEYWPVEETVPQIAQMIGAARPNN